MSSIGPACNHRSNNSGDFRDRVKVGYFVRKIDGSRWQRYRCKGCRRTFSDASSDIRFKQHKRHLNRDVAWLLVSGVSQRRSAMLLRLNRKTIVRKFIFMGRYAKEYLSEHNLAFAKSTKIEFDDLETFEHTKYKPLSVTMAVEYKTRRILGFCVSKMPAKGPLAAKSIIKYGPRSDERGLQRKLLFDGLAPLIEENAEIKSDSSPHYPADVKRHFPKAKHIQVKGVRGCVTGQGELKKTAFDPLFSINHTFAMLRANINRLFRRTWCTTKKADGLELHIALYAVFHNLKLIAN